MHRDALPDTDLHPAAAALAADAVAGETHIRIDGIEKRFEAFRALQQVSLDIQRGELVCLLGPSGCGKTTLLRILAGLEKPDAGSVSSFGKDITRLPPARREFGIVFQSYALFPNLDVAKNIAFGLDGPGDRKRARVTELLALVGLSGNEEKYPAQLSGGQQQRVALARALATNPRLLLLDEPLSALDARVRAHLRGEIRALQQRLGVTTVMVTHDQEEALAMADRIVVMNAGRIEQIGTPEEIYEAPANAFVAGFVGQANWLAGSVVDAGRVAIAQSELAAQVSPSMPSGAQVRLMIRPEDLVLHGGWTPDMAGDPNTGLAQVLGAELIGGAYRVSLLLPHLGAARVQADVSRSVYRQRCAEASVIPVTLPAERLRVFPADGASR
ncbi:putative 2-aminoethylphosphonate ABC transporter ATP-binding protein [Niveibacterium umoris]|uniref:Iron(III) transport system ATP-binding protein n=1 Tax=Niveibacterium umoris TaxID=1193620 RepID=A0A840BLJ4_9RHOO|nr:putative 2-aminoethylphosphonate ABC transporter ATP-binding protein [Niveibacterium umoris]MBB4013880.1 iron(III) transport system ATP-binding protein [Niveibacterium umoris]